MTAHVDSAPNTCGATHEVTAGAGSWDVGTCRRPARHDGDCDFQVNADEEIVLDCAACPYDLRAHVDGRCPTETEAAAAWGRS